MILEKLAYQKYCAWPETALLAKCEDRACHGAVAEKSAILTDVEYEARIMHYLISLRFGAKLSMSVLLATKLGLFPLLQYRKPSGGFPGGRCVVLDLFLS